MTETPQNDENETFLAQFVPKFFEMDPEKHDLYPSGHHLDNDMVVLLEAPSNRVNLQVHRDKILTDDMVRELALRWNRWVKITRIAVASSNGEMVTFVGEFPDGTKKQYVVNADMAWYVQLDSIPEAPEEPCAHTMLRVWPYTDITREVMEEIVQGWSEANDELFVTEEFVKNWAEANNLILRPENPAEWTKSHIVDFLGRFEINDETAKATRRLVDQWAKFYGYTFVPADQVGEPGIQENPQTIASRLERDAQRRDRYDGVRGRAKELSKLGWPNPEIAAELSITENRVRMFLLDETPDETS